MDFFLRRKKNQMRAPMRARPISGPTTAPAIQALLGEFWDSEVGFDDSIMKGSVGVVDAEEVTVVVVEGVIFDRAAKDQYLCILKVDVPRTCRRRRRSGRRRRLPVVAPVQRAHSTEDVRLCIRVCGVLVHESSITYCERRIGCID